MATRLRHQLTDRLVRNAKAESTPYRLTDGDGLYLEVTPKGSKIWRMRAKLNKKEMILTFGSYPALSLMMLIFLRTSELIEAEWSEIDLEKGVWIVPWQRMKMGKRKINPDKTDHQRGEEPDDFTKIHVPIIVPPPRWHQQKPCAYQHACVTDNG